MGAEIEKIYKVAYNKSSVAVNNMKISDDELNILATALANLVNTRTLTKIHPNMYKPEMTKYRILCADGKKRKMKRKEIIELIERLTLLAGHEITDDAKDILKGAGLW